MKLVIRVDASAAIGSGHLMRCLTLANGLRARGSSVTFVCREHEGHLCDYVEADGFAVCRLPLPAHGIVPRGPEDYAAWLGVTQETDADQTSSGLAGDASPADWLVVDHYGLDATWENRVRDLSKNILVIDDIANRMHACELLLDQNLNLASNDRYLSLVPEGCRRLLGPRYALLREEFVEEGRDLRTRSGQIARILVFFGGTDPSGETLKSCRAVASVVADDVRVDVVVGASNPHREEIARFCRADARFHYHRQVSNMAELIHAADLAFGAGGTTSWERTFLGLPTVAIAVADNQVPGSEALARQGAIDYLGTREAATEARMVMALERLIGHPEEMVAMSKRCLEIHGPDRASGVELVIQEMEAIGRARS
jgi:UDP-2,4-diacetamido-2,4,6-trideoxy-beta-L-altropyranose hydrolase